MSVTLTPCFGISAQTPQESQSETIAGFFEKLPLAHYHKGELLRCGLNTTGFYNGEKIWITLNGNQLRSLNLLDGPGGGAFEYKFDDSCRYLAVSILGKQPTLFDLKNNNNWPISSIDKQSQISNFQFKNNGLFYLINRKFNASWDPIKKDNDIAVFDLNTHKTSLKLTFSSVSHFRIFDGGEILFSTKTFRQANDVFENLDFYKLADFHDKFPTHLFSRSYSQHIEPEILSKDLVVIRYWAGPALKSLGNLEVASIPEGNTKMSIPYAGNPFPIGNANFIFEKATGSGENYIYEYNSLKNKINQIHIEGIGRQEIMDASRDSFFTRYANTNGYSIHETTLSGLDKSVFSKFKNKRPFLVEKRLLHNEDITLVNYLFSPSKDIRAFIIYVHGGGCHTNSTFSPGDSYLPELATVLDEGYAVLAINYRNSSFISPAYNKQSLNSSECGRDDVSDLIAAQNDLMEHFPGKRIFLWGHSQGGYLVNLASTLYKDRMHIAGVISVAAPTKWDISIRPFSDLKNYYDPNKMPIDYLENLNVPILLYQGSNDQQVSPSHGYDYATKAISLGKNVVTVFNDKSHVPQEEDGATYSVWITTLLHFLELNN